MHARAPRRPGVARHLQGAGEFDAGCADGGLDPLPFAVDQGRVRRAAVRHERRTRPIPAHRTARDGRCGHEGGDGRQRACRPRCRGPGLVVRRRRWTAPGRHRFDVAVGTRTGELACRRRGPRAGATAQRGVARGVVEGVLDPDGNAIAAWFLPASQQWAFAPADTRFISTADSARAFVQAADGGLLEITARERLRVARGGVFDGFRLRAPLQVRAAVDGVGGRSLRHAATRCGLHRREARA